MPSGKINLIAGDEPPHPIRHLEDMPRPRPDDLHFVNIELSLASLTTMVINSLHFHLTSSSRSPPQNCLFIGKKIPFPKKGNPGRKSWVWGRGRRPTVVQLFAFEYDSHG